MGIEPPSQPWQGRVLTIVLLRQLLANIIILKNISFVSGSLNCPWKNSPPIKEILLYSLKSKLSIALLRSVNEVCCLSFIYSLFASPRKQKLHILLQYGHTCHWKDFLNLLFIYSADFDPIKNENDQMTIWPFDREAGFPNSLTLKCQAPTW